MTDPRLTSPAALRNRGPILDVLRQLLPARGLVLEVASGTGEHVVHFAQALPGLDWQPTDPAEQSLASIAAHVGDAGLPNVRPPIRLDATAPETWPVGRAQALLCINMVHISPWAATLGLFSGAAKCLPPEAPLVLYGPYLEAGVETAPSNLAFDADLRARNPDWGLRWRHEVEAVALAAGFQPGARHMLPANNLLLLFRRKG